MPCALTSIRQSRFAAFFVVVAAIIGAALFCAPQFACADDAATAPQKIDLTYVPQDAVAAWVVQPHRVLTAPQAELYPIEVIAAAGNKEFGFNPADLEQVLVVFGMPAPAGQTRGPKPRVAAEFRFVKPVDMKTIASKLVPQGAETAWNGKTLRVDSRQYMQTTCTAIDSRTLLLSPCQDDLQWALSATASDGALRTVLSAADNAPDAALYLAIEPLRQVISPALGQLSNQLPPAFQNLANLPNLMDTLTATVNQTDSGGLRVDVRAVSADENDAKKLEGVLKQMLEIGRTMFLAQMSAQMASDSSGDADVNSAMMQYLSRISDKMVALLRPARQKNQVIMHVEMSNGAPAVGVLTALLLPAVQAAREAANRNMSQNNLKQIALCMLNYEDTKKRLPARAIYDKDGKPLLSWRVMMLPYMEEKSLYDQFHLDEPWDSEHNKKLLEKMPDGYRDPCAISLPA